MQQSNQANRAMWREMAGVVFVTLLWEVGLTAGAQKGWFDGLPDSVVFVAIVSPILVLIILGLTSDHAKRNLHLLRLYPKMSLAAFIVVGGLIGGSIGAFAWRVANMPSIASEKSPDLSNSKAAGSAPSKGLDDEFKERLLKILENQQKKAEEGSLSTRALKLSKEILTHLEEVNNRKYSESLSNYRPRKGLTDEERKAEFEADNRRYIEQMHADEKEFQVKFGGRIVGILAEFKEAGITCKYGEMDYPYVNNHEMLIRRLALRLAEWAEAIKTTPPSQEHEKEWPQKN